MFSLIWCLIGITTGVIFGIITGAGPFLAVATMYPLLLYANPFDILIFYIALIITANYTNSVTAILYGIPGDAAAVSTARYGHKLFLQGQGHLAVSNNAISSTIGSIFAIGLFLCFLPSIYSIFQFYNSTIQVIVISIAIIFLILLSKEKIQSILLFIFGGVLAKIGFDDETLTTWGTFDIDYLTLGIPFGSVMIGLYILPEIIKFKNVEIKEQNKIKKFGYRIDTLPATITGGFIGFWCGLIPGVTNILGSYLSSNIIKSDVGKIAAAESANNSGALSSVLPLIILGIPIVGSEVLIYYLILSQGFLFGLDTLLVFTNILYYIPLILIICLLLSWTYFNFLGKLAFFYKNNRNKLIYIILIFISMMNIYNYPIKEWIIITLILCCIIGYTINKLDTFPIIYGYFLSDLFWENLRRVGVIYG